MNCLNNNSTKKEIQLIQINQFQKGDADDLHLASYIN